MDKPLATKTLTTDAPEAIVVVSAAGTAVDCNNAFAKLCGVPAGMLVGQELCDCAPELAASIGTDSGRALALAGQVFELDVQPFTAGAARGDRIIRLRAARLDEVA